MNEKTLTYILLLSGISYIAYTYNKNQLLKKMQQQNLVEIDTSGKTVLTQTAKNSINAQITTDNAQITTTNKFDYNNPNTHASVGYWKTQSTGIFNLPLVNQDGKTFDYVEIKFENDGKIEPTISQVVKEAISNIFSLKSTLKEVF